MRRAFAPRAPADVQLGDVVKFSRQGGRISRGLVKYMGHLPGKNDTYLGVELEKDSEFYPVLFLCVSVLVCSRLFSSVLAFCRLLSSAIGCYRLLSAAIGCYRLLSAAIVCYRVLSSVIVCYRLSSILVCSLLVSAVFLLIFLKYCSILPSVVFNFPSVMFRSLLFKSWYIILND